MSIHIDRSSAVFWSAVQRAVAELQRRGIGLNPWSPPTGPGRVA